MTTVKFVEKGFAIVSLLFFSGGLLTLVMSGGVSQGDGLKAPSSYPLIQLIFLIIYAITFFLMLKQWRVVFNFLRKEKFIFLLIGLAIISCSWSYTPEITLRRSIALAGTTLFGIYLSIRYSLKQQLQLLKCTFIIAILLSFAFIILFPKYGIMGGEVHEGLWRGIYTHKNIFGQMMTLGMVIFLLLATDKSKSHFIEWFGFSFSIVLLVFSTSKTNLAISIVLLVILALSFFTQHRYLIAISSIIATAILSLMLFLQITANIYAPIALSQSRQLLLENKTVMMQGEEKQQSKANQQIFNKNLTTLTGRTRLWPLTLETIKKRPWLGYGYSGFWKVTNESEEIQKQVGDWATHSHNGLLNISVDLGIVGVIFFLSGFIVSLYRALKNLWKNLSLENIWAATYLTYLMLANLTQSALLEQNNIFWVLYVAIVFVLYQKAEKQYSHQSYSE